MFVMSADIYEIDLVFVELDIARNRALPVIYCKMTYRNILSNGYRNAGNSKNTYHHHSSAGFAGIRSFFIQKFVHPEVCSSRSFFIQQGSPHFSVIAYLDDFFNFQSWQVLA